MDELDLKSGKRVYSRTGFAMLLFMSVTVVIQYAFALLFGEGLQNEWLRYMFAVLPQYLIAMPLVVLLLRNTPSMPVAGKKLRIGQFLIIVMICFAIMYAGNLIGLLVNGLIEALTQNDMSNLLEQIVMGSSIWVNLMFVVVLAPVAEELFFRKLLIPKLLVYGEKPAVIMSGLIFGLIHGNLLQFFYAFGLGLAFGYIFMKTGKVIYTIILHMFINFFGSVVSVAVIDAGLLVTSFYGLVTICLVVTGVVLFFVFKKRIVMTKGLLGIPKGKRAVYLNAGTMLFYLISAGLFALNTFAMFSVT